MAFEHCHWIPILTAIWYSVIFASTYTISVIRQDVYPTFPYISDTGSWQPESIIFTLGLNVGALLMMTVAYIRYRHVDWISGKEELKLQHAKKLNKWSVRAAAIGCIALSLTGDIQVSISFYAHIAVAGLAFLFATTFLTIQTYISYQIYPEIGSNLTNGFRAFLNGVALFALMTCGGFGALSLVLFNGDDITKWTPSSGGYQLHLISVSAEWILVTTVLIYLVTYTSDFKKIKFYKPKIEVIV